MEGPSIDQTTIVLGSDEVLEATALVCIRTICELEVILSEGHTFVLGLLFTLTS